MSVSVYVTLANHNAASNAQIIERNVPAGQSPEFRFLSFNLRNQLLNLRQNPAHDHVDARGRRVNAVALLRPRSAATPSRKNG